MTDTTVLIDYGSGNLRSAEKALIRAASDSSLDRKIIVSSDPNQVRQADRLVLPGVGAFADCRKGLLAIDGMRDAIYEHSRTRGNPFLGICVGMQLLASEGHEFGIHKGMGWIDGIVKPIHVPPPLKIPHMGWNTLSFSTDGTQHPVAGSLKDGDHVYFVHSYHMEMTGQDKALATTDYGLPLTAIVGKDNIIGTQFHPEKSQQAGLDFLAAFLRWSV